MAGNETAATPHSRGRPPLTRLARTLHRRHPSATTPGEYAGGGGGGGGWGDCSCICSPRSVEFEVCGLVLSARLAGSRCDVPRLVFSHLATPRPRRRAEALWRGGGGATHMYTACLSGARAAARPAGRPKDERGTPPSPHAEPLHGLNYRRAGTPPPPPPPLFILLQGRAGVGWVSSPLPPTSPPSRRSPCRGISHWPRRAGRRSTLPPGDAELTAPLQVHPSWDPWAFRPLMHLHSCTPRVHTIWPLHYRQRRSRRFWPWSSLRCPSSGQTVWPEDPAPADTPSTPRRSGRPPVTNIKTWLECFARLAAVLVSRFPEKGPELWAYQSTILNAAHSYEGVTWVAYDRQFRREMLARKDLNWSIPNSRLYNEAFTGRAKIMQRCQHCLSEDHGSTGCPQHPEPDASGVVPPFGLLCLRLQVWVAAGLPQLQCRPLLRFNKLPRFAEVLSAMRYA